MVNWENDLVEYELETVFEFAPEEKIDLLKNLPKVSELVKLEYKASLFNFIISSAFIFISI